MNNQSVQNSSCKMISAQEETVRHDCVTVQYLYELGYSKEGTTETYRETRDHGEQQALTLPKGRCMDAAAVASAE